MRFYSGFCLQNEEELFRPYLKNSIYTVAGFSRGAIYALEFALQSDVRIDTLQLISPAFFMDQDEAYKKAQLHYFKKNPQLYMRQFLKNIAYPHSIDLSSYTEMEDTEALAYLLYYQWKEEDLQRLRQKGIFLEIYLGERDKIINSLNAKKFFQPYAEIYFIKEGGHILDGQN